ncbi:NnrS family protein [Pseudobdellovibrio exovorus]|uniref:NnrS protein involved in response to NO n=1 Tax=Pseudobdellovibrio exovorus JSS TaxID=1184267 RepID=M4V7I8_9BACT|nr:NnrS family protein [Pseudobdellovibrio exovorus]AGH95362.1 hypothetical protein A11Q_1146 [Pseudobdellovibrio exovorus JSS]
MKTLAPYQIFFPIGILCALLAVGVWFTQNLGWFDTPVMWVHGKLIAGGFLWSFIVGFLMTAVPRMTGTFNAHKVEYAISFLLILALIVFSWALDAKPFYFISFALTVFIMIYAGRRLVVSTRPVPVFFSHVGLAMFMSLVGSYFYYRGQSILGFYFYHVGTILLLVLGIGTRFFAFLSGLPSVFEGTEEKWKKAAFHMMGLAIVVLLSVVGMRLSWGFLGLALLTLGYLFCIWQVQRSSSRPSALKWAVRIVAVMIPLSFILSWIYPVYYLSWMHILFVGCFGLITFSVATRVTLAHGAYPTDMELKSKALGWMVAFIVLAMVSRVFYGFSSGLWKTSFLHLAGTFWFLAVGVWCYSYFKKIFKLGPQSKPSC